MAGGERGREHVGAADDAQDVHVGMVGDAEAADAAEALGEGADDEVDVFVGEGRFAQAAAGVAEDAQRVGLVDEEHGAGFAFDGGDLGERGGVAQHGIEAFDDDQAGAGLAVEATEAAVEVVGGRCGGSG